MSHLIVSIYIDAPTNGVCRVSSQGGGNTASAVHVLTWLGTCQLISSYKVVQRNITFLRVVGNIGRIVKDDCLNSHTIPSTLISMCHIYHWRSKHENASSDDKCGIEILMPNTKYGRISLQRTCNNDIIPDIIQYKISAKRILIFHYMCTWYEKLWLMKDQPNVNIKLNSKWPTLFSVRF